MKNAIIKMLTEKGNGISFVQLSEIDGFSGDLAIGNTEKNIYLWFKCSEEALNAINELRQEEKIEIKPTLPLVYHIDGLVPLVPIASQDRVYKSERWEPAVINKGIKFNSIV
jgi:hypothetical protein